MLVSQITHKKSRFSLAVLVAFLLIAVPCMVILDNNQGNTKFQNTKTNIQGELLNGLSVSCNLTSVDLTNKIVRGLFRFDIRGQFATPNSNNKIPNRDIVLLISDQLLTFRNGTLMTGRFIDIPFDFGNINRYPFDKYETEMRILAGTPNNFGTSDPIPVSMAIVGTVQAFRFDFRFDQPDGSASGGTVLNFDTTRSITVIFFALFIFASMWSLSFSIFTLAITLWFRDRSVEPPTIGICAALLFALPAIRNTQPGVPPIGCTLDLAGFFWCMFCKI